MRSGVAHGVSSVSGCGRWRGTVMPVARTGAFCYSTTTTTPSANGVCVFHTVRTAVACGDVAPHNYDRVSESLMTPVDSAWREA
jgi:hypothetical protein